MLRRGTYSIVARDPATGQLGAAVESHWFSTGSIVTWAWPGVGAVCTQAIAEPAYRPNLLHRMAARGGPAEEQGGDIGGGQSAALLVVPAEGARWRRDVELRVEDHPEPLVELRRLLDLADAYCLASEGDELSGQGRHNEAGERYRRSA